MTLTPQQQTTLKAFIDDPANGMDQIPNTLDGAFEVADILNVESTPTFYVWNPAASTREIEENGFIWAQVDNMTNKQERIWQWMRSPPGGGDGILNAGKGNVRVGVNQAFGKDSALWDSVMTHLSRNATVVEQVLASGGGNGQGQGIPSDSGDKPAKLGFEGPISYQEVYSVRNP